MSNQVRCLVIQIAAVSDVLQSLMALRAAKQLYPELEIHLLVREKNAAPAKKVPWITQVYTLPTEQILEPILRNPSDNNQAFKNLAKWLIPLAEKPWDMLVNWTFSEASSYISGLVPSKVKLGYSCRPDGGFYATDGWSHYVQAIVQEKIKQNIHLTDVLTTQFLTALQIHLGDPLSNGDSPVTSKYFFSLKLTEEEIERFPRTANKKWIAIQLGSGDPNKAWKPENWAKLAESVLLNHPDYGILLLGGPEDIPREQAFYNALTPELQTEFEDSHSMVSLVGDTHFDLWASAVSLSSWLFSCETAAVHLASVLGTRILNISVGASRFHETGPYGNGHYVIKDFDLLNAKDVYEVWNHVIQGKTSALADSIPKNVQVYKSRIRQSQDGGGVVYETVTAQPLDLENWSSMVLGHIARYWYCGWTPDIGKEIQREMVTPALVQNLRSLKETSEIFLKIYEKACQTAIDLKNKSSHLKSEKVMEVQEREELEKLGESLIQLDTLTERLIQIHPSLKAFLNMTKVLMHHLDGNHISEISKDAADSYQQVKEGVTIFRDWIDYTLKLIKPFKIEAASPPPISL